MFLGTVEFHAGRIVRVDLGASRVPGAEDFEGDFLLPGLIELHTDHLEQHLEPRAGVQWPAHSAVLAHDAHLAAAGITTVLDALSIGDLDATGVRARRLSDAVAALDTLRDAGALRIDHALHLRCELPVDAVPAMFDALADRGDVRLVSLMDHTPGTRQWADPERWRAACRASGWNDARIDAEFARLVALREANLDVHRRHVTDACHARGLTLASHDDGTLAQVDQSAALGVRVAEFPTTRDAARAARDHAQVVLMGAPNVVRGGSHSGNVAALDLARAGLLDALSSDYVPHALLHAAFRLRDDAGWPLARAVAAASDIPARAVGFDDRGAIRVGTRADYLRVTEVEGLPVVRGTWRQGVRVA
ncbi:MAG: alpha-D-ribose 1-methylphosphonate 5-triphosphate diphosphatase [Burkholderiales bacterium]|nr:alpha-D-ribose 1-methylphosphonate 5-triphosphate diphosphatase [Burkholderiales bacterium]